MDQCKHCTVRGDLSECLKTECNYHDLWMVKEIKRLYENEIVLANSMLEWIEDILNDKEVSDFALSFSIIRRVYELKQNEMKEADEEELIKASAEASYRKWKAEREEK